VHLLATDALMEAMVAGALAELGEEARKGRVPIIGTLRRKGWG
jgi:hypothetical protein